MKLLDDRGRVISDRKGVLEVRDLTRDDIAVLAVPRAKTMVKKLRDPHHKLAKLIAIGIPLRDAAIRSGYSYARAAFLTSDPAFKDLVAKYTYSITEKFEQAIDDYTELTTGNMLMAERMIREKLEEADEANELPPVRDLIAISRDAADRFGYGKKQTNLNVNVDFAAKLEDRIRKSGRQIIDGKVVPIAPVPGGTTPTSRQLVGVDASPEAPPPRLRRI